MSRRSDLDFDRSHAILVGTSTYEAGFADQGPMPAALHSLDAMREVLAGPCGWPATRVTEYRDQRDSNRLLRAIADRVRDVTDVLVFYYVGHGQPIYTNGRYDLGLALTDTSEDVTQRALTSLRFRDLREQLEHSKAKTKIFILDCCCSGIATEYVETAATATVDPNTTTAPLRGMGTYVWTACGHAEETFFEERPGGLTYFTKLLTEAVHEAPPTGATVAELHDEVKRRLSRTRIPHAQVTPTPDLRFSGQPDQFRFVRGRGREFHFDPLAAGDPLTVGPYRLAARLDVGGPAGTYLAFAADGQPVTVTLPPHTGFAGRLDAAWRIRDSHVAQLLAAEPWAVPPWLAGEYVCGPTLPELVDETGQLSTPDVMLITAGIAQALTVIHGSGTVHGHLAPAGIRVDESGPKIVDLATAAALAADQAPVTPASDVYALGGVAYFLATGRYADEQSDLSVLDEPVRDVVRGCLAADPHARPTAARLLETCSARVGDHDRISGATSAVLARAKALAEIRPSRQNPPPHQEPPRPPSNWPPPKRPSSKNNQRSAALVVLAVLAVIIGLAASVPGSNGGNNDNAGTGSQPGLTTDPPVPTQQYVPPPLPTFDYSPPPTFTSPSQDPISTAQVGDCFANDGSYGQPDLSPEDCQAHAFKVIQVVADSTDRQDCPTDSVDNDYDVSFPARDLVLCFEYLPSNDTYHAVQGNCVFSPDLTFTDVSLQSCHTNDFTVLARLRGTSDTSGCQSYAHWDASVRLTPPLPQLDAVLCLSFNYPDAAGYAHVGRCLDVTGAGANATFAFANCDVANAVVTGRDNVYDVPAYCTGFNWTSWQSTLLPHYAYTLCYRYN